VLWLSRLVELFLKANPSPAYPPLFVNESGWLEGDQVEIVRAHPSWHYPKLSTPSGDPSAIVAHASATPVGTALSMAKRRTVQRTKADRAASWHISIEPDRIVQMISCEAGAWHALGNIKGAGPANRVSVGIELVGFEKGPWPEAQVVQACRVWRALVQSYGIGRQFAMVPHAVLDPQRRSDPGEVWMSKHAERVLAYAYGA
jgi:N-acetyl-anhydromuramyl-L-alanine amidase AmpD